MPDAPASGGAPTSFSAAVAAVEGRLVGLLPGVRRLSSHEIAGWRRRDVAAGWELRVTFPDRERRLLVLVRGCFPFDMPRIVLVDRPDFLTCPHIEADGSLCIGDSSTSPAVSNPVAVVEERLGAAARLVEDLAGDRLSSHLRDEFLTYWLHDADDAGPPILSLLDPRGPSRAVRLWQGERFRLVADDDAAVSAWLRNRLGSARKRPFRTEPALLAWLPVAPMPPYPRIGPELQALLGDDAVARSIVDERLRLNPGALQVVIGVTCDEGPALAAMTLSRPTRTRSSDPITKGFRAGHVPPRLAVERYLRNAVVKRSVVSRVDAAWIHGRGRDPRQARLRVARVAVVGCGSVGAPIANSLARAGVGRLLLVDGEVFATANVGRHPLGLPSVGLLKASALAARIGADCPHVEVVAHDGDVELLLQGAGAAFETCDLVISATAHWPAEAMLDAWQAGRPGSPPIIYGWTEANACAGHGVAAFAGGPRFADGLDPTGRPLLEVTAWPAGMGMRAEPACSGRFQPYGPVELGFTTSMVADLALNVLLGGIHAATHRVWAARRATVEASGGRWSEAWSVRGPAAIEGGALVDLPWPPDAPRARTPLRAA